MESILQQAKADWLDRQRRQLFCLCYLDAYNTSKPSGFGWSHDKRLVIWGAVRDFIAYAGGENYLSPAFVPRYLYSGVLEWFVMHGTFPENLTATRLQHRFKGIFRETGRRMFTSLHRRSFLFFTALLRRTGKGSIRSRSRTKRRRNSGSC